MSWFSAIPIVGDLIGQIGTAVDSVHTSDEEKLQLKAKIVELTAPAIVSVVQAQVAANELQARIVEVEAKSEDRIVRWRRPILSFAAAGNFFIVLWWWMIAGSHVNIFDITEIPAVVSYSFTFAALVNGLDIGTRGLEKMVGQWSSKTGNGNNTH